MPSSRRRLCPGRAPGGRRGRQSGFVLAVTLWLLAAIAVAVGLMTLWALQEVREATVARERTEDALAMHGTRDTVLYLAATRDLTLAGLPTRALADDERAIRLLDEFGAFKHDPVGGELRLDGQPYAGLGHAVFALQDEAGLFPLVWPTPEALDAFLLAQGVEREQVPRLRDALLDYIDLDTLRRLNGAEAREYELEKRPPPPNRRLLLPGEALRVLGWEQLPAARRQALPDLVSTFHGTAVNLNTMPEALLPIWIPGCPENCTALVERRRQRPFTSSFELQNLLGIRLPGDDGADYRYLASEHLRLTLWGRTGSAWRIHVRLTPFADQAAPWSVLAAYPVPRPALHAPAQDPGSDLFADAASDRP